MPICENSQNCQKACQNPLMVSPSFEVFMHLKTAYIVSCLFSPELLLSRFLLSLPRPSSFLFKSRETLPAHQELMNWLLHYTTLTSISSLESISISLDGNVCMYVCRCRCNTKPHREQDEREFQRNRLKLKCCPQVNRRKKLAKDHVTEPVALVKSINVECNLTNTDGSISRELYLYNLC